MSQVTADGYAHVSYEPKKYDTYLVETKGGCIDFAHFNINGWSKGQTTDDEALYWREIPKRD